jgi:hypothetical protein
MRNLIEVMRLNELIQKVKQWIRGKDRNDNDRFDHPYAIF